MSAMTAAELAKEGFVIHTIGIGSTKGVPIPIGAGGKQFKKDNAGNTVIPASSYDFDAEPPAYQRLRSGNYGMTVFWLQKTLEKLGYFTDTTATGYFGPLTQSAVKRFQKANKLSADGVMNEKTYNKLVEIQKKQQIAAKAQN